MLTKERCLNKFGVKKNVVFSIRKTITLSGQISAQTIGKTKNRKYLAANNSLKKNKMKQENKLN